MLDFSKAPWPSVQTRLSQINWGPLETMAKDDVTAAHALFIDTVLPVLEELVPQKLIGKQFGKRRVYKKRRCLWRKLGRIKNLLHSTSSVTTATSLLNHRRWLEHEVKCSYDTQGWEKENKVVNELKSNVKAFYAYGRARQQTKAKVGPFIDPDTAIPNSDPDYAATVLSEQYSSLFTQPRPEYLVNNLEQFFSGGLDWRQQTNDPGYQVFQTRH